ncbi:MAG: hypothetical protein ACREJC_07950 [Tepidisphaeraceae bacterium]
MGFVGEVTTFGDAGVFSRNALVFATREEADSYVRDLASRWTAVQAFRVSDVDEAPTRRWVAGSGLAPIEAPGGSERMPVRRVQL